MSSDKQEVIVDCNEKENVATITLNRPERANSLNGNMVSLLKKAFVDLSANNNIRVIVLTGSGKYFCSGMDLMSSQSNSVTDITKAFIEVLETIYRYKKPIICKINGPALGGGLGLVFVTDIRIMYKESYFVFPEVKRGLVPAMISAYIVPQLGIYKSKQYMLSGEKITSAELLADNVVTLLANDLASLDTLVDTLRLQLLSSAPNAMSTVKQLVDYVSSHSHEDNLQYVQKVFQESVKSEEATFGIQAFLQRKAPHWSDLYSKSKL